MSTQLLIIILAIIVAAVGGVELLLGVAVGFAACKWYTGTLKTPIVEPFDGRQISLGDQCVRKAEPEQPEMPYAPEWNDKSGYDDCYSPVSREFTEDPYKPMSIDEKAAQLSKLRSRDKKCMDGLVSKNMYFYKKHYGDEIDREEAKPWWGADDF